MFFRVSLSIALVIFCFGTLFRISCWFRYRLIEEDRKYSQSARLLAAVQGIAATVFSPKIVTLAKVFLLDILLQIRTLRESFPRWLMHMGIYAGFMVLLCMHALEAVISENLFAQYYSTLNPYLFVRDLAGFVAIFGIAIALHRRFFTKSPRLKTNAMDCYAIAIIAVIMISGILLKGVQITSYSEFKTMEEDYSAFEDPDDIMALESYWVHRFGLVSPHEIDLDDTETLARGRELHQDYCADCHSSSKWAFTGYATAKMISPIAVALDRADVAAVLRYIHFLACFIGLAYLPFSKMFHIISSPLMLLSNAVMDKATSHPANLATKRLLELDACTHCGTCSMRCAVGSACEVIPNQNILPSEKIAALKVLAANPMANGQNRRDLQEGLCLCTNCHRCTDVCPVGIDLQELWAAVREDLLKKDTPELSLLSPLSIYRALITDGVQTGDDQKPLRLAINTVAAEFHREIADGTLSLQSRDDLQQQLQLSIQGKTYSVCYNCKTCTTACPLVHHSDHPQKDLGLVPHQMMHAISLGLKDFVLGSRMLWVCLGCYRCQEQCPQGVRVTDVFYQLKNIAMENFRRSRSKT